MEWKQTVDDNPETLIKGFPAPERRVISESDKCIEMFEIRKGFFDDEIKYNQELEALGWKRVMSDFLGGYTTTISIKYK